MMSAPATARRSGAITIDLDPIESGVLWSDAVPRLRDMLAAHSVRATFFVVGATLDGAVAKRAARALFDAGHELANHTQRHLPRFRDLPPRVQHEEILNTSRRIEDLTGEAVSGFRAPAWDADASTVRAAIATGLCYDASVCPTWLAPAGKVFAGLRRRPHSPFGDLRWTLAPRKPYHPDPNAPWRPGGATMLMCPSGVGRLGLPVWATAVLAAPGLSELLFRDWVQAHTPVWLLHAHDVVDTPRAAPAPPVAMRRAVIDRWIARAAHELRLATLQEVLLEH